MKNITKLLSIAVTGMLIIPVAVSAATVTFTPSSGTYTEGTTYTISVFINPQSDTIYTAKTEIQYPADLLEVRSFNFGSGWIPLTQTGYDALDNANGELIKTGGYPSGLNTTALFGTVTFYAKKSGTATVKIGDGSLALDANNQNSIGSLSSSTFTLAQKPATVPAQTQTTVQEPASPVTDTEGIAEEAAEETSQKDNVAAVVESGITFAITWTLALLLAIATLLTGFLVGRKTELAERHIPRK